MSKTEKQQMDEMTPVAVATPQYAPPVQLPPEQMERGASGTVPLTHHYPTVNAGVCEFCGVIDPHYKGFQYRLCPHFKGMAELACSYCPIDKDPTEVTRSHSLNIYDHPYERDQWGRKTKIVVCSGTQCVEKHHTRFKVS